MSVKFESNVPTLNQLIFEAAKEGLEEGASFLLNASQEIVLEDTSELKQSAGQDVVKRLDTMGLEGEGYGLTVGYAAPHAAHAHELPNSINPTTPGTQPKFLESAGLANEEQLKEMIAAPLRRIE